MTELEAKKNPEGDAAGSDTAREVFGRRAGSYAALDVFSREKYYRPLMDAAAPQPGDRVLDVATGTGLLAAMLAGVTDEVVGADVTPEMFSMARERIRDAGLGNVRFIEAGAADLPFAEGYFDLVTCRTAFHHFPEPVEALREIRRVLRTGGRFVMEDVYGPEDNATRAIRERLEKLFDPSHVMAYRSAEMFSMLVEAGFEVDPEIKTVGEDLALDLVLKLDRIEDPENREDIIAILNDNLDVDLGGLTASRVDGVLVTRWRTMIIAAKATA